MATQYFYGTWEDAWDILEAILEFPGIYLVPDRWYKDPEPFVFTQVKEELKAMLREKPNLFVFGSGFSILPPFLDLHEKGSRVGQYTVYPGAGGPCMVLGLPGCYEKEGLVWLSCGMLYYQKEFKNMDTGIWEKPSLELKEAHKEMAKRIRKGMRKYRAPKQMIWVARNALNLLNEGKARIADKGV